jgi:hypothetical protein
VSPLKYELGFYILEDDILHSHRRKILTSYIKREFNRTVRSSLRVKRQFKGRSSSSSEKAVPVGVLEPSQPIRLVGPERRVGPVGPRGLQKLPVLSKSC